MSLLLTRTVLGKSNQEVHIGFFRFTFMRLAVDEKLAKGIPFNGTPYVFNITIAR